MRQKVSIAFVLIHEHLRRICQKNRAVVYEYDVPAGGTEKRRPETVLRLTRQRAGWYDKENL